MELKDGSSFAFHTCVCNLIASCERGGLASLETGHSITEDSKS